MISFKSAPYLVALATTVLLTCPAEAADSDSDSTRTKSESTTPAPEVKLLPPKEAIENASKFADDTISKAMEAELLRSMTSLKLPGRSGPYFISYTTNDSQMFSIYGSFGALDQVNDSRYRSLSSDVRIGDYKLDSSGRRSFGFSFGGVGRRGQCSLDDDYDAIRHELWLESDYGYKRAIEALDSKKAVLQQKKVEDLPDSMTKVEPTVLMTEKHELKIDKENWKKIVRDISGVFREYPAVIDSTVALTSGAYTSWFANSEGSLSREGSQDIMFGISANGQASDGMRVTDFEVFSAKFEDRLPDSKQLEAHARKLAQRIEALSKAKPVEDYRGPILFEKQAAAELFAQALAPRLVNRTEALNSMGARFDQTKEKIGRKIMSNFLTVIDDPLAREFKGAQLSGGYLVDDEGVKAQRVTLIENGFLKTLCSGRTPSRDVKQSNGHADNGSASTSQLFVTASKTESMDKLKQRLIELGKEEGLDYVLIVRHIASGVLGSITPGRSGIFYFGSREMQLTAPTLLYKVYVKDGREELVRGANFVRLTPRLFRDIQAAGDDAAAYTVRYGNDYGTTGNSIVAPSVLVSEIDIERESHENDKPMILKNSYFADPKSKEKKATN